jgi:hypothetical protein
MFICRLVFERTQAGNGPLNRSLGAEFRPNIAPLFELVWFVDASDVKATLQSFYETMANA